MTPEEYVAYQESVGRGVVVLCPWCFDWEDVEDGFFDEVGNFWCCWACESMPSHRGEPGPWGAITGAITEGGPDEAPADV